MMPGNRANPIFFNQKNKCWTPRTLPNHLPVPTSNNISFLSYPSNPPPPRPSLSRWTSYVYPS